MTQTILNILKALLGYLKSHEQLVQENLELRQQIIVLQRSVQKPKFKNADRILFAWLSQNCRTWKDALIIVKPETVIKWHRAGFRLFWKWKSRARRGRRRKDAVIRALIRRMCDSNPLWSAPRIHGELLKLGFKVSEATVSRYMPKKPKNPSQTWRTFLANHMHNTASIDFFVVPTIRFKLLFVLIVLSHDRRRIVHFNITSSPTASWTGQQIIEAFPWDTAPKYLIRDNDSIYGTDFQRRVNSIEIKQIRTAFRSPWQNAYCERVIGSIRRECTDPIIVLNEVHLRNILREYFDRYYNVSRTHLSLGKDCPTPRPVESLAMDKVVEIPVLNGLHHRYYRRAA